MKKYFITGLLIWIPLVITLMVLAWIVNTLDQILLIAPAAVRPDALLGFHLPGIGVVVTLLLILLTGLAAANFVGQRHDTVLGLVGTPATLERERPSDHADGEGT